MPYDPARHHRRTLRLQGYDYRQPGAYFITICTQERACLFGEIAEGVVRLSAGGEMVETWWAELAHRFANATPLDHVVMPNHIHGILMLVDTLTNVGGHAGPPLPDSRSGNTSRESTALPRDAVGADRRVCPAPRATEGAHIGAPLPQIVQWFKTMTTNAYIRGVRQDGWPAFPGRLWQRNYYEHVIRNEGEMIRIREYIASNPAQWAQDRENPAAAGAWR